MVCCIYNVMLYNSMLFNGMLYNITCMSYNVMLYNVTCMLYHVVSSLFTLEFSRRLESIKPLLENRLSFTVCVYFVLYRSNCVH